MVIYNDGHSETVGYPDKQTLIREHFGSRQDFEDKVRMLKWTTLSTEYVEDISSGKTSAHIFSADVNPYGWRS